MVIASNLWIRRFRNHAVAVASVAIIEFCLPGTALAAPDYRQVVGPDECVECHKATNEVWKGTHHYSTFREMPRNKKAKEITDALGIKRIKREDLCLSCHFSSTDDGGKPKPIAGVSCESCHAAGKGWSKRHGEYSGKEKDTESKAEAKKRWQESEAAGMIRPHMLYRLATNCYSCHVVPQEELVNVGGHPAGSKFELVAWSQGEVRHNVWWNDNKENAEASVERKRMMYIVGAAVELETALRAVGKATEKKKYAVSMAKRAKAASQRLKKIEQSVSAPELTAMVGAASKVKLKLNNGAQLSAAADQVAKATKSLVAKYDGKSFAGVDSMLPSKYKGKPAR